MLYYIDRASDSVNLNFSLDDYLYVRIRRYKESVEITSISPVLQAIVAFHKSCHRLIARSDLFHVVTICGWLVAETALFRGPFENVLFHLIIESGLTHLKLLLYVLL